MKHIIVTIILILHTLIEHGYTQSNKCGIEKFQCKSGECIASELLCDGQANCKDTSDETVAECNKPEIRCPDYAFRCLYGACVDGDATCNGIKDCIDNSDETLSRCTNTSNVSTSCTKDQFKCDRQCIAQSSLCDGIADCTDGSDETFIQCGSITCSQFFFRCNYGACIDGDLKCNGIANCADGSDEDPRLCSRTTGVFTQKPVFTTAATRPPPVTSTPTFSSCTVPPQPENGYWKLHKSQCCNDQFCDHCDVSQGTQLIPGTRLVYQCNTGYKLSNSGDVFCGTTRTWSNIPNCTEITCETLDSASTQAECTYDGEYVPCSTHILPGTLAALRCRTGYRLDTTFYSKAVVRCDKKGQWDPAPIRCIPECGVPPSSTTPLIVNGTRPKISEFPWHATLYKADHATAPKEFICGATIIHKKLLITAAHCVYDEITKRLDDPAKYYVATGNIYRDYDYPYHNPQLVKKFKVKNMYMVCTYFGLEGNYAADIAILEITPSITFTSLLVPICLDISNNLILLETGNYGKIAGFGRTALGPSSFVLQSITVPYVPFNQCRSSSFIYETEKYITEDKFCAGYTNGSSVCDGDSGGGLIFNRGGMWYLKGIVSVSLSTEKAEGGLRCNSYSYSLYTRVDSHISWIQDIIIKLETHKPMPVCPTVQ